MPAQEEMERFGPLISWSKELGISRHTIKKMVAGTLGIKARALNGTIIDCYPENLIIEKCSNLLGLLQADEDGFLTFDGEKYGTVLAWARILGIAHATIKKQLEGVEGITGKDNAGKNCMFYSESEIRRHCEIFLADLSQASPEGFFISNYERYGSTWAWSKIFQIDRKAIFSRLKGIQGITGKDSVGKILKNGFYAESIVLERCANLLGQKPQAGVDGFFRLNGERYGTVSAWMQEFQVSREPIGSRLDNVTGISGEDCRGRLLENAFYPESLVREKCNDLLDVVPQAESDGSFVINGEQYRTILGWSKIFKISNLSIKKRLKSISGLSGKSNGGRIQKNGFYPESVVREKCKDLLTDMPQADNDGFFVLNGKKYGTMHVWARLLHKKRRTIQRRLERMEGISGKDSHGQIWENAFFPETLIMDLFRHKA